MLRVTLSGVNQVRAELEKIQKQIPYATMLALNNTATIVQAELRAEMPRVFDRPTNWTLNSLRILYAKKAKLEARVWLKDEADKSGPAEKWLRPEIDGGQRKAKNSEDLLRGLGLLPSGKFLMPSKNVKLDRYGNVSRGVVQKVLTGLKATRDPLARSTESSRSQNKGKEKKGFDKRYFVVRRGRQAIGIGERLGWGKDSRDKWQMVFGYGSAPSYRQRLDFYGIGQRVADKHLILELEKAITRALATAR